MLIFPIIAGLVWVPAMVWRRQWKSFVVVTVAVLVLLLLAKWMHGLQDRLPLMSRIFIFELFWPYIVVTGGVGYYIACLPRPPKPHECRTCRYDLRDLDPQETICPECGGRFLRFEGNRFDEPIELTPRLMGPPKKRQSL